MDKIFDVNYTPGSIDDAILFDLKKRCMYSVFVINLLTERVTLLVRTFERYYNADFVHKKLLENMSISTKTSVESSTILTYITTAKFISSTCKVNYDNVNLENFAQRQTRHPKPMV